MKRDWTEANVKRGPCRMCGTTHGVELAHVTGRSHDEKRGGVLWVKPERVIPLCGPATSTDTCHGAYDAHRLDCLPILTRAEQAQAVLDLGMAAAYERVTGSRAALSEDAGQEGERLEGGEQ